MYHRWVSFSKKHDHQEVLLFDTPLQAKLWILSRSTMPKTAEYMFQMTEAMADKLIAKGKYTLGKAYITSKDLIPGSTSERVVYDRKQYPLLCELRVEEYTG